MPPQNQDLRSEAGYESQDSLNSRRELPAARYDESNQQVTSVNQETVKSNLMNSTSIRSLQNEVRES